jgi:hypothetical protein
MTLAIPLETMSIEEKILAMELIWADLSSKISNIASPYWHQTLLAEREQAVQQGLQQPLDWETAKQTLRQKLNAH